MFKFEEICELIRLVGSTGVSKVEIEHAGSRLHVEGAAHVVVTPGAVAQAGAGAPPPAAPAPAHGAPPAAAAEDDGLHPVVSPIVGTFYRAPNPDADPYPERVAQARRAGAPAVLLLRPGEAVSWGRRPTVHRADGFRWPFGTVT